MATAASSHKEQPLPRLLRTSLTFPHPYLILFQHSLSYRNRLVASSSSSSPAPHRGKVRQEPDETHLYRLAGLRTPTETSARDLIGGLFVRTILMELSKRCGGKMVLVQVTDAVQLFPDDVRPFRKNGAVVDLASDPFGWDSEEEEDHAVEDEEGRVVRCRVDDLESVACAIEGAVDGLAQQRRSDEESEAKEGSQQAQPMAVPVVFDSLTPLLTLHGLNRMLLFLERLRRSQSLLPTNPIVAPVLIEAMQPSQMRVLEDVSDAVLTLEGGELNIIRRSARGGRLVKDVQPFRVVGDGLELGAEEAAVEDEYDGTQQGDEIVVDIDGAVRKKEEESARPSPSTNINPRRKKITLQHEEEGEGTRQHPALEQNDKHLPSPRMGEHQPGQPRIYMQDDDPEFDDLDEEDPDDDLDI